MRRQSQNGSGGDSPRHLRHISDLRFNYKPASVALLARHDLGPVRCRPNGRNGANANSDSGGNTEMGGASFGDYRRISIQSLICVASSNSERRFPDSDQ